MVFSNIKKLKENDSLEMIGQQNFDISTISSGIGILNKNNSTEEKPLMKLKK